MSGGGQTSARARPMKATLTFGLVQAGPTRPLNNPKSSPSSSPTSTWASEGHRGKAKRSPDLNRSSPERSSPCSPALKGVEHPKPIRHSPSSTTKRTAPLDQITGPYLTGHWPRCDAVPVLSFPSQPQDKATQTPEWDMDEGTEARRRLSVHKRSSSLSNVDIIKEARVGIPPPEPKSAFKIIKSRLAKTKEVMRSVSALQRTSPVQAHHLGLATSTQTACAATQSKAVPIPVLHIIPKSRMRGSVEGPNQEIERALRSVSGVDGTELQRAASVGWLQTTEPTPDGHRAPIQELIMRTVDTQTPSAHMEDLRISWSRADTQPLRPGSCGGAVTPHRELLIVQLAASDHSSSPAHSSPGHSNSPEYCLIPGNMDSSRPSSRDDTPPAEGCESPVVTKESTPGDSDNCLEVEYPRESLLKCVPSPRPNKSFSFAREPPDGCEKVKLMEEPRSAPLLKEPLLYCPIQKTSQFVIPSVDSAFCPLYKTYITHQATNAGVLSAGVEPQ